LIAKWRVGVNGLFLSEDYLTLKFGVLAMLEVAGKVEVEAVVFFWAIRLLWV
jgi:hypothetical protein